MAFFDQQSNAMTKDYFFPDQIDDSIQMLRFYQIPQNTILASGGWDSKVRIWNINYQMTNIGMSQMPSQLNSSLQRTETFDDPVLSICWQGTQPNLFAGLCDGSIYVIDLQKQTKNLLSRHLAGCKDMIYNQNYNILITGGWDGKLNLWDLRSNNPVMSYEFPKKIYSISNVNNLMVVALADRQISIFNLEKIRENNFTPVLSCESHLRQQTRRVCCFTEGDGYAISSVEGRVAIKNIDLNHLPQINNETKTTAGKDDFAFRCHRTKEGGNDIIYSVNDIAFNPKYGTFATVGGDGTYVIWDKQSKGRLCSGNTNGKIGLTAVDYNFNGDMIAYALGYDWSKGMYGAVNNNNNVKPQIGIHCLTIEERQKKKDNK